MLHDFMALIPGIAVRGIDISTYAIANAMVDVKPFMTVGNAKSLPFPDKYYDLVISINTVHNLPLAECSRGKAFLTVDAYRTEEERKRMDMWNLTALTYMHVDEWVGLFREVGYTGDYYWFIP
jgi:hypothetical protein